MALSMPMTATRAAELGVEKEALAVKLLAAMDVEAASAILGAMDTKRGARLIERATRLLQR